MKQKLTQKQENFCLNYVKLDNNGTQAVLASGYRCNASVARRIAAENLTKPVVSARISMLRKRLEDEAIADPKERRKVLTEIVRGRFTDFVTCGADGSYVDVGPEKLHSAALKKVKSRTEYDDNGSKPTLFTDIELESKITAIDVLNKMDKLYAENNINIDNRSIVIKVVYADIEPTGNQNPQISSQTAESES